MDETSEIQSLGEGRYSFWVGRQKYTLTTKLKAESLKRDVGSARALVEMFPQNLSQDERLFLALMALTHQMQELGLRAEEMKNKFQGHNGGDCAL